MAHAYCTGCSARVTVVDGRCLLDHRIDPSAIEHGSGRRSKNRRFHRPAPPERPAAPPPPSKDLGARLDHFEVDLRVDRPTVPEPDPQPRHEPVARHAAEPTGNTMTLERVIAPPPPRVETPSEEAPSRLTRSLAPTNDLISELWALAKEASPLDGWSPGEVDTDSLVVARRVFLGTIAAVVISIVVAASWFFVDRSDSSVQTAINAISTRSETLAESLSELDPVLADMADGTLGDREAAATASAVLDADARAVFSAAADLPSEGDYATTRAELVGLADDSIELARDVSRTAAYVSTAAAMFNRPDYPYTVHDAQLGEIAETTATWVTRFMATVTSLPDTPGFGDHREAMLAFADGLPAWQADYLDALRANDPQTAGDAIAELEEQIAELGETMASALEAQSERLASERADLTAAIAG